MRAVTGLSVVPKLLAASYADTTWQKMNSALNCAKLYQIVKGGGGELTWPFPKNFVEGFVQWTIEEKGIKANTVEQYLASIISIHKLRNFDGSTCNSYLIERLLKGGKNREQYDHNPKHTRKIMTLPLLKILGHEIANSNWDQDSKNVVWSAACLAFFGSLRFGEILSSKENAFNPSETLLWSDIKFVEGVSALLHIKVTKNCSKEGEFVDIFPFPGHNCCPLASLANLKKSREGGGGWESKPVFAFKSGKLLTKNCFNTLIRSLLREKIGPSAENLACHSFRGGIPSALASFPDIANDSHVMGWGRWSSTAYLLYTRLKLDQKRSIYDKITSVLSATGEAHSLTEAQIAEQLALAKAALEDETNRTRAGFSQHPDPASSPHITTQDLESMKKKFSFLADYSDEFIQANGLATIVKLENTAHRLKEAEKSRATEDKLAHNRDELAATTIRVMEGVDNRWDQIHPARFLPGAGCSAAQMWLYARELLGNTPQTPISSYDMAAIGLRGCVSSKGWINIASPGSSAIRLSQFSMTGSTGSKSSAATGSSPADHDEFEVLAEYKLALRALRAAMCYALPWNRSADSIIGFMEQTAYCQQELGSSEKQARVLTRFTDYVLEENSNRWRSKQPFVSTGEMKEACASFFSTLPLTGGYGSRKTPFQQRNTIQPGQNPQKAWPGAMPLEKAQFYDDICVKWNQGRCFMNPGNCFTRAGRPLRHCCNYRPNPNNPSIICQRDHACCYFHK